MKDLLSILNQIEHGA